MKRLFLLLTIIFSFVVMNAQETYRFRINHPQGFSIENSTTSGLALHYSVSEISISNINNGEAKGQEITLKGSFGSFAEGQPNLPFENRYIAIPKGATVSVKVTENGCQTLNDIEVLPAAAVQENAAVGLPKLRKDMNIFGKDANFPSENVAIVQATQIRGLDVVLLNVTPFRYNPVRKTLDIIYDMNIEVSFEGGDGQFGDPRFRNPAWDGILRDLVINSDMLPEAHYYDLLNEAIRNKEDGCEYLIISPDDDSIVAWANVLKEFRTKQGILTKVVTTTQCGGNNPESIKNYIQNAYDNWAIPPAALMIFSGYHDTVIGEQEHPVEGIGGFPLTFYNYENYGYTYDRDYYTDNIYADMNADSIPDLAISRLSALTLDEYRTQISKVISYETQPPTDPHYYDHPVITSGFENNKWFMITSQSVNGFFCDKLGKHPSNLYMPYESGPEPNIPDSVWSTGYNTSAPVDYFGPDGQGYFPRYLFELDGWRSMWENDYLVDAISEGSFLTLFRDHSASDVWCCPYFYSTEITRLNSTYPTFVLSIGCNTALYNRRYTHYDEESMLTAFCNAPMGALGGIGAVTVTRSHFNDILTWGMVDYFWPEFMPTLGTSTTPDFARPAYAMLAGKLFLGQHVFLPNWWPGYINDTYHVFHYIGETYLDLYTEMPQPMNHDFAAFIPHGQWQYEFTVEEGSTVCLSKDDEIIQVLRGTGQTQTITLPEMAIGERIVITATKHNRIRCEQTVEIIPSTQSYVYVKESVFKDQHGDHQLDYGESAVIDLNLFNAGIYASQGTTVQLCSDSPYVEILQGTATYPNIEPGAECHLHDAFRIRVSKDVPDQTTLRFRIQFNEDQNTHYDGVSIIANAPVLQIEPEFRPMTADDEPSTHIATEGKSKITFTVANKGHSSTSLMNANLDVKAPFIEIETPQLQIDSLAPNATHPFTFELNTTPNTTTGAWLQSHFAVQHLENHLGLDTILQYGGTFEGFETDTLNPLCQWGNTWNRPWIYCDEDAYEGRRCFISQADTVSQSRLSCRTKGPFVMHDCKISFRYKTDEEEQLHLRYNSNDIYLSSKEWQYVEFAVNNSSVVINFFYTKNDDNSAQAKIDDLCFPPRHTAIAYAGDDIIACNETPVVLFEAYAYDCDSILWVTDGDGLFDYDTTANPIYSPGSQDLTNGNVRLTLTAFGNDTVVSTTQIHFVDEIDLGTVIGDSVVNKYEQTVSHYSIYNPEGLILHWQLEPTEAGIIYEHGNEIDILWDLHKDDMEATLSVTADNGCITEPITKCISLIGYSIPEWHSTDFNLFPNPTDGKVNLVMDKTLQGKAVVEVYNLLGERMMTKTVHHLQKGEVLCLDLSHLVSGLYIIKLSTENGSCSKKVSVM